jgi:DNA-binding response OmpR family regulator
MTASLAGKRILVVEDEYYIAADLRQLLLDAGAEVVGPVSNVPAGLHMVDSQDLDAAVLDINLDGTMSFPIADRLQQAGVPHAFMTGYDGWALPEAHRATTHLAKPFTLSSVIACVRSLFDGVPA